MPLPAIPPWRDQAIELFHGTTDDCVQDILHSVDENKGSRLKDFGRGFYTTTRFDKAQDWANVKARRVGSVAAVIRFDVSRSDLTSLDCLFFVRGDLASVDYWSFIQYCRSVDGDHNRLHKPWYDIVVGPVTGTWKRQTIIPDADQVSFHTPYAVAVLNASAKVQML